VELFFIFLLYFTAPSYAAFAKLEVYQNVIGQQITALPNWVQSWGSIGLVGACDAADAAQKFALCKGVTGNGDGILQLSEFRIAADAIVLATPKSPVCPMSLRAWLRPAVWRRRSARPTACCSPSPMRSAMTSTTA
jgi:Na+(H+)/acetate symporter ActP